MLRTLYAIVSMVSMSFLAGCASSRVYSPGENMAIDKLVGEIGTPARAVQVLTEEINNLRSVTLQGTAIYTTTSDLILDANISITDKVIAGSFVLRFKQYHGKSYYDAHGNHVIRYRWVVGKPRSGRVELSRCRKIIYYVDMFTSYVACPQGKPGEDFAQTYKRYNPKIPGWDGPDPLDDDMYYFQIYEKTTEERINRIVAALWVLNNS